MKKLPMQLTMLFSDRKLSIEIYDVKSACLIVDIEVPPKQVMQLFSRLSNVNIEAEVYNLDKIGKNHEVRTMSFPMPDEALESQNRYNRSNLKKIAIKEIKNHIPEGWEASNYYGSQDSFRIQNNEMIAKTTIHRWVEDGD